MLTKTIKYTDYNGNERAEVFHFNISKAELIRMEASHSGGMSAMIERVVSKNDNNEIFNVFDEFVRKSYGEKSDDGKRFIKSPELTDSFIQSEAYSELISELLSNPDAATEFVIGIMPKELGDEMRKQISKNTSDLTKEN